MPFPLNRSNFFLHRIVKVLEITRDTASLYIVCLCGTPHHNYGWRERQIEEKDICCVSFEAAGNARQMDGDALFCSFLHFSAPPQSYFPPIPCHFDAVLQLRLVSHQVGIFSAQLAEVNVEADDEVSAGFLERVRRRNQRQC